jgi:hypothetical protein
MTTDQSKEESTELLKKYAAWKYAEILWIYESSTGKLKKTITNYAELKEKDDLPNIWNI